jgi:hypothetical protein
MKYSHHADLSFCRSFTPASNDREPRLKLRGQSHPASRHVASGAFGDSSPELLGEEKNLSVALLSQQIRESLHEGGDAERLASASQQLTALLCNPQSTSKNY